MNEQDKFDKQIDELTAIEETESTTDTCMRQYQYDECLAMHSWMDEFDERQKRLISNCRVYATHDPAGLPGHNLMIIVAQMASSLDQAAIELWRCDTVKK